MQKLLRRTAQAERQVARRVAKRKGKDASYERGEAVQTTAQFITPNLRWQRKVERAARREDWDMGPVAPRRDTLASTMNRHSTTIQQWGVLANQRVFHQLKCTDAEKAAIAAWAGGVERLCLAEGDRVVVIEGPWKGKIAPISNIYKDSLTVTLKHGADVS
jgi:large subunit ribosomal protein L24